jgi:hypothetical protein
MLRELGRLPVAGHEDVGERLVVPQEHVVAGLELLDEVGLEQQGFRLGRRGDEFHRRRLGDHAGDAVAVALVAGIGSHPVLQVAGLADIEHLARRIDHAIDARRRGQGRPEAADHLRALLHAGGRRVRLHVDVGPQPLRDLAPVVLDIVEEVGRHVVVGFAIHGEMWESGRPGGR